MSGLTVDKTEGTCTLGYITSVAQITLNDIKDLLPYKAPITHIGNYGRLAALNGQTTKKKNKQPHIKRRRVISFNEEQVQAPH